MTERRYDIDWIRVVAIGLLIIYHAAICFQPWAIFIGFIQSPKPWLGLWTPMSLLNVWRIPLLFFVSGMGVFFALRSRSTQGLLLERVMRILVPLGIGLIAVVPLHRLLWQAYYNQPPAYLPLPDHLWFLGNIMVYVVLGAPLFFAWKRWPEAAPFRLIQRVLISPLGWLAISLVWVLEAVLVSPHSYEVYAFTQHGFWLGMVAFFAGFSTMIAGTKFWQRLHRWRWVYLATASVCFLLRITYWNSQAPTYLIGLESSFWILCLLAWGNRFFRKGGRALSYLSQAAYPVYILHMVWLYLGAFWLFRWDLASPLAFTLLVLFTFAGCLLSYEFVIRRVPILRVFFGLKAKLR